MIAFPRTSLLLATALGLACGAPPKPVAPPVLPGSDDGAPVTPPPAAPDPDAWQPRGEPLPLPQVVALPQLKLPTVTRFTLSNGLPVVVVPQTKSPVVNLQLAVRAGRRNEPREQPGIAELTSNLLVKGSVRRNAAGLVKAIESVAGTLAVDVSYEAAFASCSVMSRSFSTCANLLGEVVGQPTFPAAELEQMKSTLVAGAKSRAKTPRLWANLHAQHLLWTESHPRAWPETEETLARLTRDDVVRWHKTWYAPQSSVLIVSGDVEPAQVRPQLERAFAVWRRPAAAPAPAVSVAPLPATRVRLVDQPGAPVTQIRIAMRGISHQDRRFFDSLVWNHTLNSRLPRALRAAKASTTSAECAFDRFAEQGSILISSAARSSEALATLQLLLSESVRLGKEGPTPNELAAALTSIAGGYVARFETAADVAASVLGADLHGFGEQYLQSFGDLLGQVTAESAQQAAAELLDPNQSVVVLVGDAKDLEPQLKKLGWRFEKVKYGDPLSPPSAPPLESSPEKVAQARKLLDAAIRAKGGEAKLRALRTLHLSGSGQTTIDDQQMPVTVSRWFQLPDRLRVDVVIDPPGDPAPATIQIGIDGDSGWQRSPEGLQDIPAEAISSVEFERWREPELVLLEAKAEGVNLAPAPDVVIDGRPHVVLRVLSQIGIELTLAFDKQTMLLRRMSYTIANEANVDDFTGYREVDGVKVSHKRVSTAGGRATTIELSKVQLNPPVDATVFKKPAP